MSYARRRIVEIEWEDACLHAGWFDIDANIPRKMVRSVGFLLERDADKVTLACSLTEDGGIGDVPPHPACMDPGGARHVRQEVEAMTTGETLWRSSTTITV